MKDGSLIVKAKELAENVEVDLYKIAINNATTDTIIFAILSELLGGEYINGYL